MTHRATVEVFDPASTAGTRDFIEHTGLLFRKFAYSGNEVPSEETIYFVTEMFCTSSTEGCAAKNLTIFKVR
jgi:hypothetical protein